MYNVAVVNYSNLDAFVFVVVVVFFLRLTPA